MTQKKNNKLLLFVVSLLLIAAPAIACGGGDDWESQTSGTSLNPSGNATVVRGIDSTTYIYPEGDSMVSCTTYDSGGYSCESR